VGNKRAVLRKTPCLDKLCFQFKELRIRVAEHSLVFFTPLVAGSHVTQRQYVARLAQRGLPPDRIAVARRACIGIDILHLGDELVAHGVIEIWIGVHDRVERLSGTAHIVEGEYKRTELMAARGRGLQMISPFARDNMPLEIVGTTDDVRRYLECGGCGEVIVAPHPAAKALPYGIGKRHDEPRILQGHVETILITVEARACSLCLMSRLPLITAFQVDV